MLRKTSLVALSAGLFIGCQGPDTTRLPPERTESGVVIEPQRDPAAQELIADPAPERTEPIPARAPERHVPPVEPRPIDPVDRRPVDRTRDPDAPRGVVPLPPREPTITEPAPGTFRRPYLPPEEQTTEPIRNR